MGQRPGVLLIASIVLGGSLVIVHRADAGWRRPHGDAHGSNRVTEPGRLAGDIEHHPGFSEIVELEQPELPATRLHDVTGDGVPELLLPYRGRLAALDLTQGNNMQANWAWQSPTAGIDSIIDFADVDGDGTPELLAAARSVGGALLSLDPQTGAILAKTDALPNRSGVAAEELTIADLDQDGDADVVYPAAFYSLAQLWVGGLGPGAEGWSLALDFTGYANITPVQVGRFINPGEPAVLLEQSATNQLFERCAPTDTGASCGGALCLCPTAVMTHVHPVSNYAFGPTFVLDVDGDDIDELIKVADDPRYTRSLSVFSPALAKATGSGAAGQLWYRDYSQGSATTVPLISAQPPVDLDDDGTIELLVSFADNLADDLDLSGAPISDGINHLGVSLGVFNARTGAVEATLDDAFAHGWLDLDGNGQPELIVSPVSGYDWQAGLQGYELGCASGCLQQAWSLPHSFAPTSVREAYGREYLPEPKLLSLRVGDQDALLAYDGDSLHLLRAVNGQLQSVASRALAPEQLVVDVGQGHALLSDGRNLQLIDAQLQNIGPAVPIPVQGSAPWLTARHGGFDAPVFESKLYAEPLPVDDATGSFAEPIELLPHVALADNLDDASASDEIIDFRRPEDELGSGFEVRMLAWQQGQLVTRWSLRGDELPALDGLELSSRMHFATGNFGGVGSEDGAGSDDLVFAARDAAHEAYLVAVDGDGGQLLGIQAIGTGPATYTPLLVGDLSSPDATPHADGLDDVLIDGPLELGLYVFGHPAGPVWRADNGFYHGVGAQADVDGDGRRELISTTSNTLDNPGAVYDFDTGMQPLWGPAQLGLPTGRTQVMAFANVDGQAGLDMLYITGEGGLELRNGQTGTMLAGAPVFVSKGGLFPSAQGDAASLAALIVLDVDNDGHDEAVLGADDGWIYALNLADESGSDNTPSLEWALEVGDGVSGLAAGDVDRDGFQELLVSTTAGQGIVLDSLGVALDIISPDDSCFDVGMVEVSGMAYGVALVDLRLNGVLVDSVSVADGGMWTGQLELPGPGEYEIRAEGRDESGELVALATSAITYGGDEDGDGVSACGGDCDDLDGSVSPDQAEICGDGIDQDCDGEDLVCEDDEDDGGSFPGPESWDPKSRCNCATPEAGADDRQRGAEGVLALAGLVVLGWRRRRAPRDSPPAR